MAWILWQEGRPGDIVHIYSVSEFTLLYITLAKIRGLHPLLHLSLLGADDPTAIKKHWNKFSSLFKLASFHRAEAITGYSTAQIQSCLVAGLTPEKLFRLPGGVDLDKFRPTTEARRTAIRKKLGLRLDRQFIVFVGDPIARKGIDVLIEAFFEVCKKITSVELLIVGPCDSSDPRHRLARNLRDRIEITGFSSRVHWIGHTNQVQTYLQAADIFCFPSRREGFGLVIIEAMAVGLPAIVSRLEGVTTDIIQSDREGLLIDGYKSDDYATALIQLLENPDMARRMGNEARMRVTTEFCLEKIAQCYADLYQRFCNDRNDLALKT